MDEQGSGCHRGPEERGGALITALLVILLLSILAVSFLTFSLTESNIAGNELHSAKAFDIAEAGLERAKRTLKTSTAPSLNVFLSGTSPGPYPFGSTPNSGNSLAGGNYLVRTFDNNDDGDPNNDTDRSVFIESTGSYRNAQRRVEVFVTIPNLCQPDGAMEIIAPGGESEVEVADGALIDGKDWDAPADPSACTSIATCGTLTGNPPIAGVSRNSSDHEVETESGAQIQGSPSNKVNSGLSATCWNNLITQLVPYAARNLNTPQTITGTRTWGTASNPEITIISAEVELEGEINGAGLLLIDGAGRLELDDGTLNWQGPIIVRGSGEVELELEGDNTSAVRIFGALVLMTTGSDPEVEAEIENSQTFLKYSSSALALLRNFLPSSVQSWREAPIDS